MSPEQEVQSDLLDQLTRVEAEFVEALSVLGPPPATVDTFEAMPTLARVASTALIKAFEQSVDTLAKTIRTQLRSTGHRLKGMTPYDVALKAEDIGQVADGKAFFDLIMLRNEFAHEYPDDAKTRFERFRKAASALPTLTDTAERVRTFADTRMKGLDQ